MSGKISLDLISEKYCDHSRTFFFGLIFIFAGNKTNHKSSNEFEFRQDSITDFRVSCPLASEKSMNNDVTTLAPSFLIGSSSSRMGLKFVQIGPWTVELAALERLENHHRLIIG